MQSSNTALTQQGKPLKLSTRFLILALVFILLTSILGYASTIPLSPQDAQARYHQVQSINPTTLTIFENNVLIALLEFIPILGPIFAGYVSYSTGLSVSAIALSTPQSHFTGFTAFLLLLITPIYWLEFFSYSLAVQESITIVLAIVRRGLFRNEWKWAVGSIALVIMVLLVSARLEVALIHL